MQNGIVVKSTGSWTDVLLDNGNILPCKIKGNFKIQNIKSTNPIAVGDRVEVDEQVGLILAIKERKNYLIRRATNLSKQSHIIAANLDQIVVLATLVSPRTSLGFIDRILVTASVYSIPAIIVWNKMDIYDAMEQEELQEIMSIYNQIGYQNFAISVKTGYNFDGLMQILKNKVSLLTGHSGVGKSSFINYLIPNLSLKINEISAYHQKGKHTTTFAEMLKLPFGGFVIDTPGIKEFGLVEMSQQDIADNFPEILNLKQNCKYNNCQHINEPGCAVVQAVENQKIAISRYQSYLSMLSKEERKR